MPKLKKSKTALKRTSLFLGAVTGPTTAVSYDTLKLTERPSSNLNTLFKRCRTMADESRFLAAYLPLKYAFYDYGFSLMPGPLAKGNAKDKLAEWQAKEYTVDTEYKDPKTGEVLEVELNMTTNEAIQRFMQDVWHEWLLLDTVVAMWTDSDSVPVTLQPEKCRYQDKLGIPILYYTHGLSRQEMELLNDEQRARFEKSSEIMLNPAEGEHYKVMTRGLTGDGFVKPRLYSLLRTLGEEESKEIGYHARAYQMRGATRHHKVGHEITNGVHAGKGTWFASKKRSDKILEFFDRREGPHDFVSNFDHIMEFPWPDVSVFDTVAFKGSDKRICDWGGPLAQMLRAEKVIEGGLQFERTLAGKDREKVAAFMRPFILNAFKAPKELDLQCVWSDLCFIDPARAAELIKFAVQQGISSYTTAGRMIGFNMELEGQLKLREADDPDAEKKYRPMWDTSHALAPAQGQTAADLKTAAGGSGTGIDAGSTNGHPAGTPNNPS